jgi:hypothetical protein
MTDIQAHIQQQDVNSLLLYIQRHSQHVRGITVTGFTVSLFELPACPQLRQLSLEGMDLMLCTGTEHQGVLAANTDLQQLQLIACDFIDGTASLAAALQHLPLLQRLVVNRCKSPTCEHRPNYWGDPCWQFPGGALNGLQQLTGLELHGGTQKLSKVLQHLCHLTNLEDLQLWEDDPPAVIATAETLSQLSRLTRLQLGGSVQMEAAVLAGKSRLQHLHLKYVNVWARVADGDDALTAGSAALLSELQRLQQLTHLSLSDSMTHDLQLRRSMPSPAAYSSLLASSKLHTLDLGSYSLSAGAWSHIFPARKHFPNLLVLDVCVSASLGAEGIAMTLPDMQRLVSCCPNLQQVSLSPALHTPEMLAPLCSLTGLHTLRVLLQDNKGCGVLQQMTGLKDLTITGDNCVSVAGLLQLTALQQLSHLKFSGRGSVKEFKNKVSLWRAGAAADQLHMRVHSLIGRSSTNP